MKRYIIVCIALAMLLGSAGIAAASAPNGNGDVKIIKSDICIVNGLSTNEVQEMDWCWEPYILNFNKPVISFMATPEGRCAKLPFDAKDIRCVRVEVKGLDCRNGVEVTQYKVRDDVLIVKCNLKDITPLDHAFYCLDVKIIVETKCEKYILTDCRHVIPVVVRQNVPV